MYHTWISEEETGEEILMSYDAITTNSNILEDSEYDYTPSYQRLKCSPRSTGRHQSSITTTKRTLHSAFHAKTQKCFTNTDSQHCFRMCMINIYPPFTRHRELSIQQHEKSAAELIPQVVLSDHNALLFFDALKFQLSLPLRCESQKEQHFFGVCSSKTSFKENKNMQILHNFIYPQLHVSRCYALKSKRIKSQPCSRQ